MVLGAWCLVRDGDRVTILGIETSCDETACAAVRDGREVLSSVVYTQIPLHQPYGGVVPEVASRAHIEKITGVVAEAMDHSVFSGNSLWGAGAREPFMDCGGHGEGFVVADNPASRAEGPHD